MGFPKALLLLQHSTQIPSGVLIIHPNVPSTPFTDPSLAALYDVGEDNQLCLMEERNSTLSSRRCLTLSCWGDDMLDGMANSLVVSALKVVSARVIHDINWKTIIGWINGVYQHCGFEISVW